jgi:DNA-binding LytR/AlgR family response regulator
MPPQRDAVSQLDLKLGMQVNRSVCVAYKIIEDVETAKGRAYLHLKDGEVISLANSRKQGFLHVCPQV